MKKYIHLIIGAMLTCSSFLYTTDYVFVTASDKHYFEPLKNLIGSIHHFHFDGLNKILVYDLGFTEAQKQFLGTIQKVSVRILEQKNPDIFTRISYEGTTKTVPGAYSFKPVAIKQAFDEHELLLWIDAGTTLLKPIHNLFEHIQKTGYFFHNGSPPDKAKIGRMLNKYATKSLGLDTLQNKKILDATGLEAGFQGLSHYVKTTIVLPSYELAGDISNFLDFGVRGQRHDQAIFSALVRMNHYHIFDHYDNSCITLNSTLEPLFHIACEPHNVSPQTSIYASRGVERTFIKYIQFEG